MENIYSVAINIYLIFSALIIYQFIAFNLLNNRNLKEKEVVKIWINDIRDYDPIPYFSPLAVEKSTIENLNLISERIKEYCDNNDMNLRLLRSYYYTLKNNNELIVWQMIISFSFGIFGYLLKGVISGDLSFIFLGVTFSPFQIFTGFIIIIFLVYKDLIKNRDKTLLIYNMIEEIIIFNEINNEIEK